ncbi:MAG: hypothetical protein R2751_06800 [Bacteroidales bacterium]
MNQTLPVKRILLLFLALLPCLQVARAQSDEQREQFRKDREAYFKEKLELTDAESRAFLPLYEDYENRKNKLFEDERNIFNYCAKNKDNLDEAELKDALQKIREVQDKQHALDQEYYHEKFTRVLPISKVLHLYKVEWDYRRHLLRQIRDREDDADDRGKRNSGNSDKSVNPQPVACHFECPGEDITCGQFLP